MGGMRDEIPDSVIGLNIYVDYCGKQIERNEKENVRLVKVMKLAMDRLDKLKEGGS